MDAATIVQPLFRASGIRKAYGGMQVLDGIDISLGEGETVAIIGKSGSGKSTLLRCLNLIDTPDAGQAALGGEVYMTDGKPIYQLWEIRKEIALVFQDYSLFPNMTVRQNITCAHRTIATRRSD